MLLRTNDLHAYTNFDLARDRLLAMTNHLIYDLLDNC